MIRRAIVPALFVLAAVAAVAGAVDEIAHAAGQGHGRPWLVACYAALKAAVIVAFALFVILRGPARERSRDPIAFLACGAAIAAILLLSVPDADVATPAIVAGDLLALLACAWMLASVLALGRCFGVLPEARGLVTRGPYRLVRHPVYLGEIGACAGLVLAAPSAWNLALLAVFGVAQAVRMRLEERALTAAFPEYEAYAQRTPRLVPGLRRAPSALPAA